MGGGGREVAGLDDADDGRLRIRSAGWNAVAGGGMDVDVEEDFECRISGMGVVLFLWCFHEHLKAK